MRLVCLLAALSVLHVASPSDAARKRRAVRKPRVSRAVKLKRERARTLLLKRRDANQIRIEAPTRKPSRWGHGPFVTSKSIARFMRKQGLADPRFQLAQQTQESGVVRNVLQVPAQHLGAYAQRFSDRQNLMGVMMGRGKGWQHLIIRLGDKTIELGAEYIYKTNPRFPENGRWRWYMSKDAVYSSSIMMTERLIQLKPHEMKKLKELVKDLDKQMREGGGEFEFQGNCAAIFLYAQVGYRGEYLSDLINIENGSNSDWAMDELHAMANERVVATVLHLPKTQRGSKHPGFKRLSEIVEDSRKYPANPRAKRVD